MTKTMGDIEWTALSDEDAMYTRIGEVLVEAWLLGEIWQVKASGSGWAYEKNDLGNDVQISSNFVVTTRGVGKSDLSLVAKDIARRVEELISKHSS